MTASIIATVAVAAILILFAFWGYHKGFLRLVLTTMTFVITMVAAGILVPQISTMVEDSFIGTSVKKSIGEFLDQNINKALEKKAEELQWQIKEQVPLQNLIPVETNKEIQSQIIKQLPLPKFAIRDFQKKNTKKEYKKRGVSDFTDYLEARISGLAIHIISYLILLVVIYLVIRIILRVFGVISRIPIIGGVNRILGALVGLLQGLLIIWAVCLLIMLLAHTPMGAQLQKTINGSAMLKYLYDNNGIIIGANALFQTFL